MLKHFRGEYSLRRSEWILITAIVIMSLLIAKAYNEGKECKVGCSRPAPVVEYGVPL